MGTFWMKQILFGHVGKKSKIKHLWLYTPKAQSKNIEESIWNLTQQLQLYFYNLSIFCEHV